jgi:hypothetical protein
MNYKAIKNATQLIINYGSHSASVCANLAPRAKSDALNPALVFIADKPKAIKNATRLRAALFRKTDSDKKANNQNQIF